MKKLIVSKENPNGILMDLTSEEISIREKDLEHRLTTVEVQLEERWKETILRIKRIEAILVGTAGTMILLLVSMIWRM